MRACRVVLKGGGRAGMDSRVDWELVVTLSFYAQVDEDSRRRVRQQPLDMGTVGGTRYLQQRWREVGQHGTRCHFEVALRLGEFGGYCAFVV